MIQFDSSSIPSKSARCLIIGIRSFVARRAILASLLVFRPPRSRRGPPTILHMPQANLLHPPQPPTAGQSLPAIPPHPPCTPSGATSRIQPCAGGRWPCSFLSTGHAGLRRRAAERQAAHLMETGWRPVAGFLRKRKAGPQYQQTERQQRVLTNK